MRWFEDCIGKPETCAEYAFGNNVDPTQPFQSSLPAAAFLKNTTLDPGLGVGVTSGQSLYEMRGRGTQAVRDYLARLAARDATRLQQHIFYEMGISVGVLSTYRSQFENMLRVVDIAQQYASNPAVLARELAQTALGAVSQVLSSTGNPYAMIAGQVVGLAVMLWNMFEESPNKPAPALPSQEYDDATDTSLFDIQVKGIVASSDWTALWMPRFEGLPTIRRIEDTANRQGWSYALGGGYTGHNTASNELIASGGIGMIPGGRRISSIMQSLMMEKRRADGPPYYESRVGACWYSDNGRSLPKVLTRDVGTFYPASGQGMMLLWDTCQKLSPQMYAVDAHAIRLAWHDYMMALWDGIVYLWGHRPNEAHWGTGAWRCGWSQIVANLTIGRDGNIGGVGSLLPSTSQDHISVFTDMWNRTNLYEKIVRQACEIMTIRQVHYLRNTTIAAYLTDDMGAFRQPDVRAYYEEARERILQTDEKYQVRLRDVIDGGYRSALENVGGGTTRPLGNYPQPGGGTIPLPSATPAAPEEPPPPRGGNPFGPFVPKSPITEEGFLDKYGTALGVAGGAALVTYLWWLHSMRTA